MKEIFNILDQKEKKVIGLLCLLLLVALFSLFFTAIGEKKTYFRTLDSFSAKKKNYEKLSKEQNQKEKEWLRWQEARSDMEEIRAEYFYKDNDVFQQIRLDLKKIFNQAGIHVSQIKYDYAELEKNENVKKVMVIFNFKGSYFYLRRFLSSVEEFPKFLIIEKIDFINIETQKGVLGLRIILVAYYES